MKKKEVILIIVVFLIIALFFDLFFNPSVIGICYSSLVRFMRIAASVMIHISLIGCLLVVVIRKKFDYKKIWIVILIFTFIIPILLYFGASMIDSNIVCGQEWKSINGG